MNHHLICNSNSLNEGKMKIINIAANFEPLFNKDHNNIKNKQHCSTQHLLHLIFCTKGLHNNQQPLIAIETQNPQKEQKQLKNTHKKNPSHFINSNLTKYIVEHSFINLQSIIINNTEINSMEFTIFVDAPRLQDLFLFDNQITNFNSLNRLQIPQLKILNVGGNQTQQFNLERMNLSQNPQSLLIEDKFQDQIKLQDLSKLVKLKSQFLQSIEIFGENRIKQDKVRQVLKKRFYQKTLHENTSVRLIEIIDYGSCNPL